jgi:O-antigen ligase
VTPITTTAGDQPPTRHAAAVRRTSVGLGVVLLGTLSAASSCTALALGLAPAVVLAVSVVPVVALVLMDRPRLALLVATGAFLLPEGIVPAAVASPVELGLLALATLAWLRCGSAVGRRLELTVPMLLLVLYFAWALTSTMWAEQPQISRRELVAYGLSLTLLFLLMNVLGTRQDLDAFMRMLAWIGWILVLIGLGTLAVEGLDPGGRLQILDSNANQYGNTLLLTAAGVLWTTRQSRSASVRTVGAPCFLLFVVALVGLTASRGSLLAFWALLLALVATAHGRRAGLAALGSCVLLAVALGPVLFSTTIERLREPPADQIDRGTLWAAGWDVVREHPLEGVGVGNGPYAVPQYIDARANRDFFVGGRNQYPAHNPLIEVAADTGIVGMGLFAGALGAGAGGLVLTARRARRSDGGDDDVVAYAAVVGAASVGFLLAWGKSGGGSAHVSTYVLLAMWGLAACATRTGRPHDPPQRPAVVRAA